MLQLDKILHHSTLFSCLLQLLFSLFFCLKANLKEHCLGFVIVYITVIDENYITLQCVCRVFVFDQAKVTCKVQQP